MNGAAQLQMYVDLLVPTKLKMIHLERPINLAVSHPLISPMKKATLILKALRMRVKLHMLKRRLQSSGRFPRRPRKRRPLPRKMPRRARLAQKALV